MRIRCRGQLSSDEGHVAHIRGARRLTSIAKTAANGSKILNHSTSPQKSPLLCVFALCILACESSDDGQENAELLDPSGD